MDAFMSTCIGVQRNRRNTQEKSQGNPRIPWDNRGVNLEKPEESQRNPLGKPGEIRENPEGNLGKPRVTGNPGFPCFGVGFPGKSTPPQL
jgi:hypothetical protein